MKNNFKKIPAIFAFSLFFSTLIPGKAFAEENDEQKYLKNVSQLTFAGKKNGEAYFSPDGKKIIFQGIKKDDTNYQIYTMNKDGSSVKMVSTGKGKTTCAYFSPDGKNIIYSSSHLKPDSEKVQEQKPGKRYEWDFEEGMDIFQAREDGSGLVRLTNTPGYDAEGTYSPDGKQIIFTSNRDGDLELYVMNADGSGQKRLTNHPGYDGGAFFSPDGKKIVYRRFDRKGHAQIILANADGSEEKQLTNSEAINWCPYFHPDGKHIIFSSNMLNPRDFDLFITDLEGKNTKRITFDPASDVLPVFSPDGKQLLWTSTRNDKKSQIFLADFDLNEASELSSSARQIYEDIKYLAADHLEGRRSGSLGAEIAAEYIRSKFQQIGLLPGAEQKKNFFQSFQVSTGVSLGEKNYFNLNNKSSEKLDYTPLSFSENGTVEGELVFAGYGISAAEYNYDDYDHLDVKDKVVVVLRHEPQETDSGSIFNGNKPTPYSEIRYKVFNAKRHGAKGLILLNGPINYPDSEDQLLQIRSNEASGTAGLPAIQVKNKILAELFRKKNYDLNEIQTKIDKNLKPYSFSLVDKIEFNVDLKRNFKETVNVIGLLEGTDPQLKNETIIIGAHYDHLGFGGEESLSSAKQPEIHNGADDNASGVAGVIELARRLKELKPKRSIVFIAFSGEELGLLGSSYFTKNGSLENVISMINLDMVGRLTADNLYVGGIKTAENFEELINEINRDYGFKLSFFKDGYGPSDHMSFYLKNIPVLFFFTGVHNDYHKPSDDFYKVDVSGLERIVGVVEKAAGKIADQAEKPKLVKIEPPVNTSVSGKSYGAYLGTIPDYTSDMNSTGGVTLSGVKEGGPAQQAGLKGGDIIIRFDEIKINNLYDYTFALRTKKPGEKVNIVVIREGKEQIFLVELGKK